jgi:hypothetical protein
VLCMHARVHARDYACACLRLSLNLSIPIRSPRTPQRLRQKYSLRSWGARTRRLCSGACFCWTVGGFIHQISCGCLAPIDGDCEGARAGLPGLKLQTSVSAEAESFWKEMHAYYDLHLDNQVNIHHPPPSDLSRNPPPLQPWEPAVGRMIAALEAAAPPSAITATQL